MKTHQIGSLNPEVSPYQTTTMSIDDAGLDFLMHNLSALYSSPAKAVLREYTANALDSHSRAGQTKPVKVTLPTQHSPYLVIQDFGIGLDKDEINNVYSRYGSSTKRDSNKQIGAFGLGCKSALALADRFDLVAVKDGVKNVAFVKKNERGVGVFHFVSEEATTEGNGVTVTIPVKPAQYSLFSVPDFFRAWKPGSIEIDGVLNSENSLYNPDRYVAINMGNDSLGWVATYEYTLATNSNRYTYERTIRANCGGILYELPAEALDKFPSYIQLKSYYRDVYVNLPIGSIVLTPSREEINMMDSTAAIVAALDELVAHLPAQIQAEIEAETERTAVANRVFNEQRGTVGMSMEYRWRGEVVPKKIDLPSPEWAYIERRFGQKLSYTTKFNYGVQLDSWMNDAVEVIHVPHINDVVLKAFGKDLKDYAEAKGVKIPRIYLTTRKRPANPWVKEFLSSTTVEEFKELAKAERSKRYAAARMDRAKNPVVKVAPLVTVLGWNDSEPIATNVDELTLEGAKILYIHKSESDRVLTSLFPNIRQVNQYGSMRIYDRESTFALVKEHLSDYKVVFLSPTRSLDKFLAKYPDAQKLEDVLRPKAKELVDATKAESVALYALRLVDKDYQNVNKVNRLSSFYRSYVSAGATAEVKDGVEVGAAKSKRTVDILSSETLQSFEVISTDRAKTRDLKATYWAGYSPELDPDVNVKADEIIGWIKRYPLLVTSNLDTESSLDHIVHYVNMVDAL